MGRAPPRDLGDRVDERRVDDEHLGLGEVEHVREDAAAERGVDRRLDRAAPRDRERHQRGLGAVRQHRGDQRAAAHAEPRKPVRELGRAPRRPRRT